jgi:hypothetical protein
MKSGNLEDKEPDNSEIPGRYFFAVTTQTNYSSFMRFLQGSIVKHSNKI